MNRPTRRIATVAATLALVLALSALIGFFVPTADALPNNEIWIFYYSDAGLTNLVGQVWRLCDGSGGSWGLKSGYGTLYTAPCM